MNRRIALAALTVLLTAASLGARADTTSASSSADLTGAEQKFVADATATLGKKYADPAAARRAGYVRYTNEDATGAISYANVHYWNSTSIDRPSQLWYDVNGRLLGADYSALVSDHPTAPSLFGVSPSRLFEEHAHVHYVVRNADGSLTYSRAVGAAKYAAAGLDPMHPTAAGLVKVGAVDSPDQVATVFLFPHIWDFTVWVLPNPNGAFADANPDVKPSKTPGPGDQQ